MISIKNQSQKLATCKTHFKQDFMSKKKFIAPIFGISWKNILSRPKFWPKQYQTLKNLTSTTTKEKLFKQKKFDVKTHINWWIHVYVSFKFFWHIICFVVLSLAILSLKKLTLFVRNVHSNWSHLVSALYAVPSFTQKTIKDFKVYLLHETSMCWVFWNCPTCVLQQFENIYRLKLIKVQKFNLILQYYHCALSL